MSAATKGLNFGCQNTLVFLLEFCGRLSSMLPTFEASATRTRNHLKSAAIAAVAAVAAAPAVAAVAAVTADAAFAAVAALQEETYQRVTR